MKKGKEKFDKSQNGDYNSAEDIVISDEEGSELDPLKKLREKLKICVEEKQEYLEGWQRAKADFINYKKGDEERRLETLKFAKEDFVNELLPVLDSFSMAEASGELKGGVEQIYKQFVSVLEKSGVEVIDPAGEDFDPNFHEAVEMVDGEEEGKVVEVLQKGYLLNKKIIRPARVRVGKSAQGGSA